MWFSVFVPALLFVSISNLMVIITVVNVRRFDAILPGFCRVLFVSSFGPLSIDSFIATVQGEVYIYIYI